MLIKKQAPGISSNSLFESWIKETLKIKCHENLYIGLSKLGGSGLFLSKPHGDLADDLLIARIPNGAIFDYISLLKILNRLKEIPVSEGFGSCADIIIELLKSMNPTTETEILCAYFVGFKICFLRRKEMHKSHMEVLDPIEPYVELLSKTPVLTVPENNIQSDPFVSRLKLIEEKEHGTYEALNLQLSISQYFGYEVFHHILAAVRSRVLEIPHENKEKGEINLKEIGKEEKEEKNCDDYYTNISLVPLLDFANHLDQLTSNAYYDIDRDNGDILLKLKHFDVSKDEVEVTISYSREEHIQDFIRTYGFIPKSGKDYQLLELFIPDDICDQVMNDLKGTAGVPYRRMMKWLRILPVLYLIGRGDEIYISFSQSRLPLIFLHDLKYHSDWPTRARELLATTEDNLDEATHRDEYVRLLEMQENEYDTINGIDNAAVSIEGMYPSSEELANFCEAHEDIYASLLVQCFEFAKRAITLMNSDDNPLPNTSVSSHEDFDAICREYQAVKTSFCSSLLSRISNGGDVCLPELLSNDHWKEHNITPANEILLYDA